MPCTASLCVGRPLFEPGVMEIQNVGIANAIRTAEPTTRNGQGRRMIEFESRTQKPLVSSVRASSTRMGTTRIRPSQTPQIDRSAGRSVTAARIEISGMIMPPIPIERMKGKGNKIRPASPTATVRPLNTTACPAYSMVGSSASRTSARVRGTRRASPSGPSFRRWIASISSRKR